MSRYHHHYASIHDQFAEASRRYMVSVGRPEKKTPASSLLLSVPIVPMWRRLKTECCLSVDRANDQTGRLEGRSRNLHNLFIERVVARRGSGT